MKVGLVLWLLAAVLPAAAQPRPPAAPWTPWAPWSVESPGSLGARFGLGLDLALDRLDDVVVVGGSQSVTTLGADGGRQTTVAPVDVELTNRKHRQGWEERTLGFQAPVALPPFHLPGTLRVEPSLVLEVAAVEGELTFVDLVERTPDRTLDGTAARWGAGVEALGELCRGCRWFWSAGYRYRSLGGLDLGGGAPGDPRGPTVTQSAEIDHDSHHLTARLGALIADGRATAWVGVRERRSELVVSDESIVVSPQGGPPPVAVVTRLDLDADDTAALAGVDFRLDRRHVGRVEAALGGQGEAVLFKVVQAHHRVPAAPERPRAVGNRRQRAAELAEAIAPRVDALRQEVRRRAQQIEDRTGPGRALPAPAVLELLGQVEAELREILAAPELLPVLSWFLDFLDRARADLAGASGSAGVARPVSARAAPGGLVFAVLATPQEPPAPPPPTPSTARGWLARLAAELGLLFTRADTRQLTQDLCVRSRPQSGALVTLWPQALTSPGRMPDLDVFERWTENRLSVFYRGLYDYRARLRRQRICAGDEPCPPIDLWRDDGTFLVCDFAPGIRRCGLFRGTIETCGR